MRRLVCVVRPHFTENNLQIVLAYALNISDPQLLQVARKTQETGGRFVPLILWVMPRRDAHTYGTKLTIENL